jgi:TolB-like protein/DNA-binding winged helix-turn-helix (wHTH) protein/Tfp pilus assembly protein PilF
MTPPLAMPPGASPIFRFRDFELDVAGYQLRRRGRPIRMERRPLDLLILLVERRRQLVSRTDIVERLWGDGVFVDVEMGVNTAVRKVRQALGDSADSPTFVETVQGRGYRFIAEVEVTNEDGSGGVVEPSPPEEPVPPAVAEALAATPSLPLPARPRSGHLAVIGLAIALLAALAAWGWIRNAAPPSTVTLAVLPFENLGRDPERDYLADGLTEETIAALGQIDPDHLRVIGRTSTLAYRRTGKSLDQLRDELGVDYVVESSLRAEGARLRITSKLIRVRDQVQIWSASYDSEPTSVLNLQRELSTAIAEQVRLRLSPERLRALGRRQTRDAEAYDLYLRGRYFWNQLTPPTTRQAIKYFEQATALDPGYALAWSGLADAYVVSPINGDAAPLEVLPRAHAAAEQAVRADGSLAEAQTSMAMVQFWEGWDIPASEASFHRAIALDAGYELAYRTLGMVLAHAGRHAEAKAMIQRARELEPLIPMSYALSSHVAYLGGQGSEAVSFARQAIVVDPEFWIGHFLLGEALEGGRRGTAVGREQQGARPARLRSGPARAGEGSARGVERAGNGEPRALRPALCECSRARGPW